MLGILLIWDSSKEVENILEEFKEILKNSYQSDIAKVWSIYNKNKPKFILNIFLYYLSL